MQRNSLLFKYVQTVTEKNLPSWIGIKSSQRDWFIDVSYAASLWQELWWERILKNLILKKIAQTPGKAGGSKEGRGGKSGPRHSKELPSIRWWLMNQSMGTTGLRNSWQYKRSQAVVCTGKWSSQNTCQLTVACRWESIQTTIPLLPILMGLSITLITLIMQWILTVKIGIIYFLCRTKQM